MQPLLDSIATPGDNSNAEFRPFTIQSADALGWYLPGKSPQDGGVLFTAAPAARTNADRVHP